MKNCPDNNRLLQFVNGELDEHAFDVLDGHIESCEACQDHLANLTDASLEQQLIESRRESESGSQPLPQSLLERLTKRVIDTAIRSDSSTFPAKARDTSGKTVDYCPTRLGDYEIVREIGRGGMGVVYEARQLSLDRIVAVKVLPRNFFPTSASVARFRREARAASKLHHTNIVPIYEVGEVDGVQYYSMQLIDGVNLSTESIESSIAPRSKRSVPFGGTLPGRRSGSRIKRYDRGAIGDYHFIADVGRQVAEALEHAHQRDIIHRDVKPANLILDEEGVVWLADFGLAKQLGDELTGTMEAAGTLRFMSPERFQGICDRRSDVYSLGMTLYELLTGQQAFATTDHLSLLAQIKEFEPPPPRSIDANVPRDLETIVRKAMSKSADRRYRTAQELADDLLRYHRGEPIRAREVSVGERLWLWARKRKALAASLAAICLLLITTAIGASIAAIHFRNQEHRQSELANANINLANERAIEASEAQRQRDAARQNAYFADIRQAHQDWKDGDILRMMSALQRYVPTGGGPDIRGWEWSYLLSLANQEEKTILDFEGFAKQLAWSSDGTRLFSGDSDGVLRLWGVEGKLLKELKVPGLKQFALNQNASQVATVNGDDALRIWNTQTGKLVQEIRVKESELCSVGWGRVPNLIAVASRPTKIKPKGEIVVLDPITTWAVLRQDSNETSAEWLLIRPQGDALAVGGIEMGAVIGFLGRTDRVVIRGRTECMAWHPDGRRFAIGNESQGLAVYNIDPQVPNPQSLFSTNNSTTYDAVAFSTDGNRIYVGSRTQGIDVYDVENEKFGLLRTLKGHLGAVHAIAPHPNGEWIASSSTDGSIKLWRTGKGVELDLAASRPQQIAPDFVEGLSPDGRWRWRFADGDLKVFDTTSRQEVAHIGTFSLPVDAKFFPQQQLAMFLAGAPHGREENLRIYDIETWQRKSNLYGWANHKPFTEMRGDFGIAAHSGLISVFNGLTGTTSSTRVVSANAPSRHALASLNPMGDVFAVGCASGEVKIFNSSDCKEIASYGHRPDLSIHSLCWGNQGRVVATASFDQTAIIWDTHNQRLLHTFHGLKKTPYFGFNHDDSRFMAADETNLRVWDVETGRELLTIEKSESSESIFESFSSKGRDLQIESRPVQAFDLLSKLERLRDDRSEIQQFQIQNRFQLAQALLVDPRDPQYSPSQAVVLSQQLLDSNPTNADFLFVHALAHFRLENYSEALRWLRIAKDNGVSDLLKWEAVHAMCQTRLGHDQEAAESIEAAIELINAAQDLANDSFSLINEFARAAAQPREDPTIPVVVTTLTDKIDGNREVSLRDAVLLVPEGGTIRFDVEGTIELRLGPIEICKSMSIVGPGKTNLAISGGGVCRVFLIDDRKDKSFADVALTGMRLTAAVPAQLSHQQSRESGGAIVSNESLSVTDSQFDHNYGGHAGGAVYAACGPEYSFRRCSFIENSAISGGAIAMGQVDSVLVDSCTFESNRATWYGGGAIRTIGGARRLTVRNSTFTGNSAAVGSRVAHDALHSGKGGAIVASGEDTMIEHCTFTKNSGGAILSHFYVEGWDLPGKPKLTIANSIIHGNTDIAGNPADTTAENGNLATISHSIIGEAQGGFIDGGGNLIGVDPKLGRLEDNGGPTKTHALLEGSPSIDAGAGSKLQFDQRGEPFKRSIDGDGKDEAAPDIGAYEFNASN